MFKTLLESRAGRARRTGGVGVSIAVHTMAIALAIAATARATAAPPLHPPKAADIVWAAPSPPPQSSHDVIPTGIVRHSSDIAWPRVTTIALPAPPGVVGDIPSPPPVVFNGGGAPLARGPGDDGPIGSRDPGRIYELPMVEKAATPAPGNPAPVYPAALRAAQLEGSVIARFVVDTSGRAEPASMVFLDASHPAFADAVRRALLQSRYLPAMVAGRPVRQLVEQRFTFDLRR